MQIWVPDVRTPEFVAEAHRQSAAIAASEHEQEDQAFVDAVSWNWDEDAERPGEARRCLHRCCRGTYTGKPLPVVIVQDDRFDATASVTVCPLTTNPVEAPLTRIVIEPSPLNGLDQPSRLMVDKVTTIPRVELVEHLGRLPDADLVALNRALIVFLGLAT